MKAARYGYMEIAEYLLDNDIDINAKNYEGNTPLFFAAWEGRLDMIKYLISKGADINAKNELDWNALMQACVQGHFKVAKFLVDQGLSINQIGKEKGATPLILAAWNGSYEVVKLLLYAGADKSIKDKDGKTAKDHAKEQYHDKIVELLE